MRRRSPSISVILTLTAWPTDSSSSGLSTWCMAISDTCTRPSTPSVTETNAPKGTVLVTAPSTTSPTW